jgi:GT2 family glycosyltransferase
VSDVPSSLAAPDRRCLVVVCHNSPVVYRQTAQSLMELGWGTRVDEAKAAHGFSAIDFFWSTDWPRVDMLRDSAADMAMKEGFSHVLFLDADMIWPTDLLMKMLRHHDKGIVGGLYVLKSSPFAPVALVGMEQSTGSVVERFAFLEQYTDDLAPVDVLGMGCTLVPLSVFSAIGSRPWFEYREDDAGWPRVTEDVAFCRKASAAGYSLWLDSTIKCGHVTTTVIDERYHHRYQVSKAETEKRLHVQVTPGASVEAVN